MSVQTAPAEAMRTPPAPRGWHSHAFGLDLRATFPIDGIPPDAQPGAEPTLVELAAADELTGLGPDADWETLGGDGDWRLERHERHGYRLHAAKYGTYLIASDRSRIACAPPEGPRWCWQRCLIGQALPLAALLGGHEIFHASAVSLDGRAIAFSGQSTAGKTSLAVNLVLRGAGLLTDDVLAVSLHEGVPVASPGAGVVSIRHEVADALRSQAGMPGPVLGRDGEDQRTLLQRDGRTLPLAALYFLERRGEAATGIERIDPDPRRLLLSSFNFVVQTESRLLGQLAVCAGLARHVPQFLVRIGTDTGPPALAALVEAHARELTAARDGS